MERGEGDETKILFPFHQTDEKVIPLMIRVRQTDRRSVVSERKHDEASAVVT